jgi:homoserine kinase type II
MSVYTELTQQNIEELLAQYALGDYRSHKGISAGVENTNYFVETTDHSLVLTLFEKHTLEELPFYLQLGEHLHKDHCKVPLPFRNKSGDFLQLVKNKPAVFIERLKGVHVDATISHALEIAKALANIHLSTQTFTKNREHSHGLPWVKQTAQSLYPFLSEQDQLLLNQSLTALEKLPQNLPCGVIHADLFHDNALFDSENISGVIDWYFAGNDSYALDIAIALNDWCLDGQKQFHPANGHSFIDAYDAIRPLNPDERDAIPLLQVQSATRFWLSRLLAKKEHESSDDNITVKNPEEMKLLLAQLINYTD